MRELERDDGCGVAVLVLPQDAIHGELSHDRAERLRR